VGKQRVGRYSKKFRRKAVERLKTCDNIVALAKELGVHRRLLYKWRDQFAPFDESAEPATGSSPQATLRRKVHQIKRVLVDKTLEVDFFHRCLAKSRSSTPADRILWREGVYDQIEEMMPLQGSLSIERMCPLAQVSRAGFYRHLQGVEPVLGDMEVRSTIQAIAVQHRRRDGYCRITAALRRRGRLVNHKRVARIMREDNLLAVQPRTFRVTTDSAHELEVFLNLASRMQLTGDQSTLGRGYHLHPPATRVRLSGGDPRRVLAQGGGLGAGPAALANRRLQPLGHLTARES
jgi:transposase-like protein